MNLNGEVAFSLSVILLDLRGKKGRWMKSMRLSQIFLLIVDGTVMGTIFRLDGRRPDGPIAALGPHHVLFIGEVPPIGHSLLATALPLLLCQHSKLLDDLLGLEFLHLAVVGRLLQLDDVVLLALQVLEDVQTGLLVLLLESGIGQGQLAILGATLILLLSLELGPLSSLVHDAEVDLAFIGIAKRLMGLFDGMPGILRPRVLALIRMEYHSKGLVLFLDLILSGSGIQLEHVIGIVELLVGQSIDLDISLQRLGLDGFVLDSVDLPRVVGDLLAGLVLLLHSLLNIIGMGWNIR